MHPARALRPDAGRHASVLAVVATVLALLVAQAAPAWAADPGRDRQWALDVIGADASHVVARGTGTVIAIVDSGVDLAHEDLAGRLVAGRDFVEDDDEPQDEFGHGTHVAGIAAATGGNGRGIVGTAPQARIMPVRVLDADGRGTSGDVEAGVRWAVDHGADVVNLSLGETAQGIFGSSLTEAVRYAWEHGVVVVVAAGNDFVLSSGFGDEPALVVSATTRDDTKPDYSNGVGGAQWGMAAPGGGCGLLSGCPREDAVFSTYWVSGESDQYAYSQGTSMAAPHVAGAAAVLRSVGLGPRATVDRLLATAQDVGPDGRDSTFGAGRLDLAAATSGLAGGGSTPPPAPSPAADAARPPPSPAASTDESSTSPASPAPTAPASPTAPSMSSPSPSPATVAVPRPSPTPSSPTPAAGPRVAADGEDEAAADRTAGTGDADAVLRVIALGLVVAAAASLWASRRAGRES